MKRSCFTLGILFFFAACSALPPIDSSGSRMRPDGLAECGRLFPQGRWQFQHAIEATLPGGQKSMLIGISDVSTGNGSIRSILMTIEGLVVFDAVYEREVRVLRAFSPFNSDHFAQGLMDDIRLIFFLPGGNPFEAGTLPNGSAICRYRFTGGQVVDIVRNSELRWQLQQYDRWFSLERSVDIFFNDNFRFDEYHAPGRLKLTTFGYAGYTLDMDLIEAVFLKDRP